MLSLKLLGPIHILLDGKPVKVPRRKSRALLYYLAAQQDTISREHLWTFFWPEHQRAAAQQVLRTTLHGLRKLLGTALQITADNLAIGPEADIDIREFESGLDSPAQDSAFLAQVLELYRGEFLADFFLPDSAEFENWLAGQREPRFVPR